MKRYVFLTKESIFAALNKLRAAFLAAKDGHQVESIIKAVLTYDERMKIGRRIQIAQMLQHGLTYREISDQLKVGLPTINSVDRKTSEYPEAFELIVEREKRVTTEFKEKAFRREGGSMKIYKSTQYTGFSKKDVKR